MAKFAPTTELFYSMDSHMNRITLLTQIMSNVIKFYSKHIHVLFIVFYLLRFVHSYIEENALQLSRVQCTLSQQELGCC